jgi:hypothetical protein
MPPTCTLQIVHERDVAMISSANANKNSGRVVPMTDTQLVGELLKVKAIAEATMNSNHSNNNIEEASVLAADPVVAPIDENGASICWSGRIMAEEKSRKFFEIINNKSKQSLHSHPEEELVCNLPEQFTLTPGAGLLLGDEMSLMIDGASFALSVDKEESVRRMEMSSYSSHHDRFV